MSETHGGGRPAEADAEKGERPPPEESRVHRVVFDEASIRARVEALAGDISTAYGPEDRLLALGVLKGSFVFLADLVRCLDVPHHIDFVVASSYGSGKVSTGDVKLRHEPTTPLEGRAVLVVEDIVESGNTLERLLPWLRAQGPSSVEVCTLLRKRVGPITEEPRWIGFDAPNEFLVGYGLDYAEAFRHLPYIASL